MRIKDRGWRIDRKPDWRFDSRFSIFNPRLSRKAARLGAKSLADFDAIHVWHHPVEDCQPGCIFAVQGLPGFSAVASHQHFMSPFGQHDLQHVPGNRIIFRQQLLS
jgi:hypothetical protein